MNFDVVESKLSTLGISKGDILYVASDVSLLLHEEVKHKQIISKAEYTNFLDQLIDMLKSLVGENGTLLFPVFTWDFCRGKTFDYLTTQGDCGVLSNRALQRSDFVRTKHPMYSFAVYGKYAEFLKTFNNTDSWGKDSPFAWLHQNKAKQLLINVSTQRGLTFMHYVEQENQVAYRYMKNFVSNYKDENGNKSKRSYSMYVRDLESNPINDMPEEFLDKNGAACLLEVEKLKFKLIDLDKAYDVITKDIQHNNAKNVMHY